MATDYMPKNDQEYDSWLVRFVTNLNGYAVTLGLLPADIDPIDLSQQTFDTALTNHLDKMAQSRTATVGKNSARSDSQALVRAMVRRISGNPNMTDEMRQALGLNVPQPGRGSASVGEEVPDLFLESVPGSVIVHFGTNPTNERINGKPSWAKGANIYRKKTGESDYQLVSFETASPFIDPVNGPASDYTYVVRYRGTKSTDLGFESSPMSIAASGQLAA